MTLDNCRTSLRPFAPPVDDVLPEFTDESEGVHVDPLVASPRIRCSGIDLKVVPDNSFVLQNRFNGSLLTLRPLQPRCHPSRTNCANQHEDQQRPQAELKAAAFACRWFGFGRLSRHGRIRDFNGIDFSLSFGAPFALPPSDGRLIRALSALVNRLSNNRALQNQHPVLGPGGRRGVSQAPFASAAAGPSSVCWPLTGSNSRARYRMLGCNSVTRIGIPAIHKSRGPSL